ncbi:MAG: hypothetical protein NT169_17705 [Chloroflexi bacterium]|nr:hypothetical protein [Chloroflexota bacterium]
MTRSKSLYVFVAVLLALLWPEAQSLRARAFDDGLRDLAALAFEDLNGDGAYGLTGTGMEPALPGVAIGLYRDLPPTASHGPEDTLVQSGTTNPDGYVVFRRIPDGSYFIVSDLVAGYLPTTPLEQSVYVDGNSQGTVLEYLFGQLPRNAFRYHLLFIIVGAP